MTSTTFTISVMMWMDIFMGLDFAHLVIANFVFISSEPTFIINDFRYTNLSTTSNLACFILNLSLNLSRIVTLDFAFMIYIP